MAKKNCLDGEKWDNLINKCIRDKSRPKAAPTTQPPIFLSPVRDAASRAKAAPLTQLSPALCAIVVLVTVGSILALAAWLIIYRRQTRLSSTSGGAAVEVCSDNVTGDTEPALEPLQKTEPPDTILPLPLERNGHAEMFQLAGRASSPCSHLYLGAQRGSEWEGGFTTCRGLTQQTEVGTMSEHRIPLPATELGGTALVTTKTV